MKLCNSPYCDEMGPSGDFSAHLGFVEKSRKFPGAIFLQFTEVAVLMVVVGFFSFI